MSDTPTSMLIVRAIMEVADDLSIDVRPRLVSNGVAPGAVRDPTATVPDSLEWELWETLCTMSDEPGLGLKVAGKLLRGSFRGLEYSVRACDDLEEALKQIVRFQRLLHGAGSFELRLEPSPVLDYRISRPCLREQVEFDVAAVVRLTRQATAIGWSPRRVHLAHPSRGPAHERLAEESFGCRVTFSAPRNQVEFAPHDLSLRMKDADEVLHDILEGHLESMVASISDEVAIAERVAATLANQLARGDSSLAGVARQLGMSERSLQRELNAEGLGFRELLDQTRGTLAREYLKSRGVTLTGVATMLGYSDVSAFYRAFRRWTDMSPGDYLRSCS